MSSRSTRARPSASFEIALRRQRRAGLAEIIAQPRTFSGSTARATAAATSARGGGMYRNGSSIAAGGSKNLSVAAGAGPSAMRLCSSTRCWMRPPAPPGSSIRARDAGEQ